MMTHKTKSMILTRSFAAGLLFLSVCVLSSICDIAHALDEQITDKYPSAGPSPEQEIADDARDSRLKEHPLRVRGYADIQLGYDNNIELNSKRLDDAFFQSSLNLEASRAPMDGLRLGMGTDVFSTLYFNFNTNDLLDISPYARADIEIFPDLISINRVILDYYSYPNEKENTFMGAAASTMLRHYFLGDIYHEAGCEYLRRWYPDRKITLPSLARGDDDRADGRLRVKYNLGYLSTNMFAKLRTEWARNDSNSEYQAYYDYDLIKIAPSVIYFFTDRFYANTSLTYRHSRFRDRRSSENERITVRDNTYLFNFALYIDVSRSVSVGASYTYSENDSNDPYQRYSGSIFSSGIYCSF